MPSPSRREDHLRSLAFLRLFAVFILSALPAAIGCGGRTSGSATAGGLRVYVSDEPGGHVAIIDPVAGRVVDTIAVGKRPRGIRVLRDGLHLLVALSGSPIAGPGVDESTLPPGDRSADGIGLVDLSARKVTRILHSGQDPETFALSPDEKTLYVSNEETAEMSVVDVGSGEVRARVHVGEEPEGVAVSPDGRFVYVTCEADNVVVAVAIASMQVVARMTTGARPRGVVFSGDGAEAFVTAENGGVVTVIDANAHRMSSTIPLPRSAGAPTPPRPMGAVLSPDGHTLFVSNGRARSIAVIDVATRGVLRTFDDVGARPWGIGISPDGRMLYTANGSSGDVSIIDAASGQVARRVAVGGSPWGLVVAFMKPIS